ncbi:fluoride efflux transporter CrcB [Humibacillus xanthopallidus]|uniref:Fluoride-specific ion channel FluC n=1 Tax=Humibacillus xanthopallidus TaxID=412689 RepID=A0A543I3F6_9MICO|nr:fluoride efflux transporter CrcB [Humibacillus xanthopallidus]TQM65000.1 camphor resistance protein CrcB [Humibacillus xanthopallidus]
MTLLLVLAGGVIGAPLRYLTDLLIQSRHDSLFPWGTFTVNIAGSLVLGAVLGAASTGALPAAAVAFIGTGICGALTTFSTFGFETVRLLEEGSVGTAALNAVGSLAAGLVAGSAGWFLVTALA